MIIYNRLGHWISYTETCFSEYKWTEWSSGQPAIMTSNIHKVITTIHIVDNIDREKKYLDSLETHNINSVLIQTCSDDQQFSKSFHVDPKYVFFQENTRNYLKQSALLNVNF